MNVKDVVVVKKVSSGTDVVTNEGATIALHTRITDELKEEGVVREIIRGTNAYRKEEGLTPQLIVTNLYHTASASLKEVIERNKAGLCKQTASKEWKFSESVLKDAKKIKVEGGEILVEIHHGF